MKFNIKLNTIKDVEDFTDYANNVNEKIKDMGIIVTD